MRPTFQSKERSKHLVCFSACCKSVSRAAPGIVCSMGLFVVFSAGSVAAENDAVMQMSSSAVIHPRDEARGETLPEGATLRKQKERAVELNEQGVALAFQGD